MSESALKLGTSVLGLFNCMDNAHLISKKTWEYGTASYQFHGYAWSTRCIYALNFKSLHIRSFGFSGYSILDFTKEDL